MSQSSAVGPLTGVRVVEVALGVSVAGSGLAVSLPGSLLRDLGAQVARVESAAPSALDAGLDLGRAWNRGKDVTAVDDVARPGTAAGVVAALAREADIVLLGGPEERLERQGIGYPDLSRANPRLITARIRPSVTEQGPIEDYELLAAARAGLLSQIRAHRQTPGDPTSPAFSDLSIGAAGAGLSAAVGVLALLYQREATGRGGWAETSLHDGLAALLPMIIGSVERHSPTTALLWKSQGPGEALSYRCKDGEYVQLWFGGKGAFEAFLEHIGDPPSEAGYNAELMSDAMEVRGRRWAELFATREREWWVSDLAGQKFRCVPVLRPGEALRDPHVREIGLAVDHGDCTFLGPAVRVTPAQSDNSKRRGAPEPADATRRLLDGIRVLDLSAYLAGPVTPLILGELGADVVKVEPPAGDVHRRMAPMFAAGQRGKRAVALDLKGPDAAGLLPRMFRWADVVHHNSRVGLAEKLGYDEASVRAARPDVVYSFASGFGEAGPRALLPANDQLMQALAGIEAGQGGAGQPPTYLVWGAVDTASGWVTAAGVLAGLYARRRTGAGQTVSASLLGAALTLKSGAFIQNGDVNGGLVLDADQTGYGAGYRIYRGRDGAWLALVIPDQRAWDRLRAIVGGPGLPSSPPPLRTSRDASRTAGVPSDAERVLEAAFATRDAAAWVAALRAAGVPAEPVVQADRTAFAAGFTADPVLVQRGRVISYEWGEHGRTRQPCFPPAIGPVARPPAMRGIPGLGEHSVPFLKEI